MLHKVLEDKGLRLILASQSPRRRALIEDSGLQAECLSYDVAESYPSDLEAEKVPEYLAELKSDAFVRPLQASEILITADTVVILKGRVLGKPADAQDAKIMLAALSGAEHQVVTGVTVRSANSRRSFSTTTKVRFAQLSTEEIDYYVERYQPLDKAGSYGIQEWIGYVGVESIEGSFYNVMGLPIQRLYSELRTFISEEENI